MLVDLLISPEHILRGLRKRQRAIAKGGTSMLYPVAVPLPGCSSKITLPGCPHSGLTFRPPRPYLDLRCLGHSIVAMTVCKQQMDKASKQGTDLADGLAAMKTTAEGLLGSWDRN